MTRKFYLSTFLFLLPMLASAVEVDGFYYTLNLSKKTAAVAAGSVKYAGDVVIPSQFTYNNATYTVTSIGSSAFLQCEELTSVSIPNTVTSIALSAFRECTGLTSVVIPESVTTIGKRAFSGCENLVSVNIPDGVKVINDETFAWCAKLKSVNIPDGVTSIGERAFIYCTELLSVNIPDGVTSIGDMAFAMCTGFISVTIPESVTSIGQEAFFACDGIASILIPKSVTSIGTSAFCGCTGLTSIVVESGNPEYDSRNNCNAIIKTSANELICGCTATVIPYGVETIGNSAFKSSGISGTLILPESVKSIGDEAFIYCEFSSLVFPNSLTQIGEWAFFRNPNLTAVTIPRGVTSIGMSAFGSCDSLAVMEVEEGNPMYDSRNQCNAIIETARNRMVSGCRGTTFPEGLTVIGELTFNGCDSLTTVTLPNSLTTIEEDAFGGCTNLATVIMGTGIKYIREQAFGCPNLRDVYCYAERVPTANDYAFLWCAYLDEATLHVPANLVYRYRDASPWNQFGNIVELTDEETGIVPHLANVGNDGEEYYLPNGQRVSRPTKGLNIVKSDGKSMKVLNR